MGPAGSGKTTIALGLAKKLQERGVHPAYFKPVGEVSIVGKGDEDGILMRDLLRMQVNVEEIVPVILGYHYLFGANQPGWHHQRITEAFTAIAREADLVIIDGAVTPFVGACLGIDDVTLAREFGALAMLVLKLEHDYSVDEGIFYNNYLAARGVQLLGNIFNNTVRPLFDKARGVYKPLLDAKGYHVLGIVPQRSELALPTVAEYYEALGGEILTGEDCLDQLVEDVLIGAMTIESALSYLRRSSKKAVITGGDRADLALSALETSTAVLILTGGLYPDVKVLARASEKGVPVMLVHYDTFEAVERLHAIARRIKPGDERAIQLTRENIERFCHWEYIVEALSV